MSRLFFKRKAVDDEHASLGMDDEKNKRMRLMGPSNCEVPVGNVPAPEKISIDSSAANDALDFLDFIGRVRKDEVSKVGGQSQEKTVAPAGMDEVASITDIKRLITKNKESSKNKQCKPALSKPTKPKQTKPKPKPKRQTKQPTVAAKQAEIPLKPKKTPVSNQAVCKPDTSKPKQTRPKSPPANARNASTDIAKPIAPKQNEIKIIRYDNFDLQKQQMLSQLQATPHQYNLSMQELYHLHMLQQQQQQQQHFISSYLQRLGAGAGAAFTDNNMLQAAMRQKEQGIAKTDILSHFNQRTFTH